MQKTTRPKRRIACIALAVASALALTACGGSDSGEPNELNLYAWAGEVPDSVIEAFEKETGISVNVDTFDSNETMIAKLSAGNTGYDIVEPSQYAVQNLAGQNLVDPIDYSRVQGMDNVMDKFVNPGFDPENKHAVPWVWGTTGLLYNQACTKAPLTSWNSLFDPAYRGKIYMLDNMLASYIVGLQSTGSSATSTDEAEIERATEKLLQQKPLLAGYNSTNYYDLVAAGDACASLAWGGSSVGKVVAANPDVKYTLPVEGGTLWVDSFSIAKGAPHPDAAYQWLNFVLRPEVGAMATNDGSLATTNQAAQTLITDPSVRENPAIFVSDDQLRKAEFILDPGEAMKYYQDGWTRIKAS
ncbi:spermidine/putrescine ABC transporter substrate-binding protein [Mycolicibacterium wolinskyi]|uniref:Spermidine/putrecine ABC transporter substrate-binding protein n=1 Tax=Mycolicibacterium wolinskyi TaxID=59750 RepID=A0A1X2EZZ0_9MYCO|nr:MULTISPECIES: spermidine/putrescine ABC transporter substrate-binding protein [Mycolicibacterium]MCV7288464.1 spermidine/putrescine ABC transporter substrate-binding protein [Mycolicibacterium wolinskyi]MCV7295686.1 spermidine/putrescine ABC transporter substrate-binding protein [Mycolicibacterium goodii]ORX11707.1 spermidine/putrecine ABC transporter substrate-binding protein [Mycolicibacterium wolinskyi]